jgi:hypothetical protein
LSRHSVAVVLTLVQTKHKQNNTKNAVKQYKTQYIQVHILAKHTHTHTHTAKQVTTTTVIVKTNTLQNTPKFSSHNLIKYPQYKSCG